LRKAVEDEEENLKLGWGERPDTHVNAPSDRKEDVIRKHEAYQNPGLNLLDKGVASTTKKIV